MAGGADWDAYNLPAIWSMIQPENSCAGADRVLSWLNLASACREQHRRLLAAREELAEVWPPGSNASARVFLERLDLLAASLDETLNRAEQTRVGLQGVVDALGAAQTTIRPLVAERVVVSDDLVPRFLDHAEDEYDERARQAMREAEAAIAEHGTQIQAPELYRLRPDQPVGGLGLPDAGDSGPGGDSGAGSGPDDGALRAVPRPVEVPHDPPAPSSAPPPSSGTGPELAGVVQAPSSPVAASAGVLPGAVIGAGLGSGPGPGLPSSVAAAAGAGLLGSPVVPIRGAGAASGRLAAGARRPLPSGAVIGPAGPGVGVGGRAVPGRAPSGAGRGASTGDGEGQAGGADQRWGVLAGVAPVIAPDTAVPDHGPGPGVIGLDR
ncbi:hypothetical protein ACIBSW_34905 [Actinoplanes sp. NPDC049668]|uniref:hypothetical protein n=1 Tax=unclassified Actinoplanes TaxID=2626549 RepID=UPI0033BAF0CA